MPNGVEIISMMTSEVAKIILGAAETIAEVSKIILKGTAIVPVLTAIAIKAATIMIKATNHVTKARAIAPGQAHALQIASQFLQ